MVHTLRCVNGMDLAWCLEVRTDRGDTRLEVRRIGSLGPRRLGRPQLRKGALVAADRGAFDRWHLQVGDLLEIREV
jgi:hypothetical protein